ncbi:hypothetical protein FRX31_005781, partial [Thalictrum thalictroides]
MINGSLKKFEIKPARRNSPTRAPRVHGTVNMILEERESSNQCKKKVRRVWQIREDNGTHDSEIAIPVIRNGSV